jgi:hypothetical protein
VQLTFPSEEINHPLSVITMLNGQAATSNSAHDINLTTDINDALRRNDFPAAAYLLGRPLTAD